MAPAGGSPWSGRGPRCARQQSGQSGQSDGRTTQSLRVMPILEIEVPPGAVAGQWLRVDAGGGQFVDIIVPAGVEPGTRLGIDVPAPAGAPAPREDGGSVGGGAMAGLGEAADAVSDAAGAVNDAVDVRPRVHLLPTVYSVTRRLLPCVRGGSLRK